MIERRVYAIQIDEDGWPDLESQCSFPSIASAAWNLDIPESTVRKGCKTGKPVKNLMELWLVATEDRLPGLKDDIAKRLGIKKGR